MSFAGKDKHRRASRIIQNFAQPIEVAEQHGGSLISRKAARKADGEDIGIFRIDVLEQPIQMCFRTIVAEMLGADAFDHHIQHFGFQRLAYSPE